MTTLFKTLIFVLMAPVLCCASRKPFVYNDVKPSELHLYTLMQDLKATAVQFSHYKAEKQFSTSSQVSPESTLIKYLDDSIILFENIVHDFNKGCLTRNPEIFFKFANICQNWKGMELSDLEPKHLRNFKKKIQRFDRYVKRYCLNRKDILQASETVLFNRLIILNQRILDGLFIEDLLGIDVTDKIIDTLFVRPYEFVCENPVLCSCMGIITLSFVGYFYAYPAFKKWTLKNANPTLRVDQPSVIRQRGQTCGIHAIWNAHCLHQAQGDRQRFEALANDGQAFNTFYSQAIQLSGPVGRRGLEGNQVRAVLQGMSDLSLQNFLVVDHPEIYPGMRQNPTLLRSDQDINSYAPPGNGNTPGFIEYMQYHRAITQFGLRQNSPNSNDVTCIANIGGHWIACHFTRDPDEQAGMRIIAANSTNRNVSNNMVINRLSEILSTGTYDVSANN